jgi:hypothetical protein
LDGPLPKWCPAVALSRQDGRHSAVALLLKAALIQVSDYRLLGSVTISLRNFVGEGMKSSSNDNSLNRKPLYENYDQTWYILSPQENLEPC